MAVTNLLHAIAHLKNVTFVPFALRKKKKKNQKSHQKKKFSPFDSVGGETWKKEIYQQANSTVYENIRTACVYAWRKKKVFIHFFFFFFIYYFFTVLFLGSRIQTILVLNARWISGRKLVSLVGFNYICDCCGWSSMEQQTLVRQKKFFKKRQLAWNTGFFSICKVFFFFFLHKKGAVRSSGCWKILDMTHFPWSFLLGGGPFLIRPITFQHHFITA